MKTTKSQKIGGLTSQLTLGIILLLGILLTGCGPTQSRIAVWGKEGDKLSFQAVGKTGNFSTDIVLYVNGDEVAKGSTTTFRTVANLSGTYKGHKIDAECKSVAAGGVLHRECVVYVDSEKAAELSF